MSDDPFAAFKEAAPPSAGEPEKKKRGPKPGANRAIPPKKTALDEAILDEAIPAPKKERKKRTPPKAGKEMRLPISMLLEIGSLSDEESGALLSIGAGLQKLPKKSRGKITAALSKIFR